MKVTAGLVWPRGLCGQKQEQIKGEENLRVKTKKEI